MKITSKKLVVNTNAGTFFYKPEEIMRLQASSNYTHIYFTDKKKMTVAKAIKDFVKILEPLGFVRTHRSHLVNRKYISQVTSSGNIIMEDTSVAEISRRLKKTVMKTLQK